VRLEYPQRLLRKVEIASIRQLHFGRLHLDDDRQSLERLRLHLSKHDRCDLWSIGGLCDTKRRLARRRQHSDY
jgi:hypothetical protein